VFGSPALNYFIVTSYNKLGPIININAINKLLSKADKNETATFVSWHLASSKHAANAPSTPRY
jgi:hypothetical protein